ncbi:heat shock 70 kDa protein 12A-like [Ruditapes philippinarum]|uniref:heat shock 70 kDa protein 12A-like n=1 Tax=Ruditapes philippinarum TaxID=129788 RepID=UPI00295AE5DC|nr:heat shock 70 kDa protein 12A-like [Ruditapes philippinarum]XP_060585385.1 heat shock 70 kDa protein 12A-like [Ruditapes philippinarum]XP_060585386.1 heat shock 70 kDa protein 12A-like [Ruditapes philippinarum]
MAMAAEKSTCNRLLVAAIDFGTTYSGYAFSFSNKPNDIHTNPNWVAGSQQLISLKCPSTVLLKPDKTFHSFGFEAENKYMDLADDSKHHSWYLFRRFKMTLYETTNLKLDTPIEDISGKNMPAIAIFAHSILFLKNHLWKTLQSRVFKILETDIQYVITVPAIWDPKAKQFMRRAAYKAGIPNEQISFALEPEAASLWCQTETDDKLSSLSEPLTKYMVVDLGGGTADITVHQKMDDGSLKEIQKASGGAWGGNEVDKSYLQLLENIVQAATMNKFQREEMNDYFDLLREFETKKRSITRNNEGKITFKLPLSLCKLAELDGIKIATKIERSHDKKKYSWIGDKLRIEKIAAKALFAPPIEKLLNHVKNMFEQPEIQDVDAILLVGGFSECDLVTEAFEQSFPDKRLLIPKEAGLAVLKGAVRFGHHLGAFKTRIARFTIGRQICPVFEKHHDPARMIIFDGVKHCKQIFHKYIEIGEEIPVQMMHEEKSMAVHANQENIGIKFFSSTNRHVTYTTEPGCQKLGKFKVDLPKSKSISDKEFTLYLYFGETEIHVRVKMSKTNEEFEKWIDCFSK